MKILINDANILIDLVKVDLFIQFADLPYDLYTTDFILSEVDQKEELNELIEGGKLSIIVTVEVEDFRGIYSLLEGSSGLSFEDCSAWYYSKKMNGTLVTGDGKLRKIVQRNMIEVRGIIFILDEILNNGLINFQTAIEKIELLYKLNNRLPRKELKKRIDLWEKRKYAE